jgi:hypothetical protein
VTARRRTRCLFIAVIVGLFGACHRDAPVVSGKAADDEPHRVPQGRPEPIPEGWGRAPAVVWEHARQRDAVVIFIGDGGIKATTRHLGGESSLPYALPCGSYRAVARLGNQCDSREFMVTPEGSEPARLDEWELTPGHGVLVRVERNGEPAPGAEVFVDSFDGARDGLMTYWGRADGDGRFLLSGIPRDIRSVHAGAMLDGRGRSFDTPLGATAHVIDIGDQ